MNNNPNHGSNRKEKKQMNVITKTTSAAVLVALGLTLTAWAAEPLPYGHKDFVPTPEQPVYFRQTYGNYPGATPPLEWWEGTPTTKKVREVVKREYRRLDASILAVPLGKVLEGEEKIAFLLHGLRLFVNTTERTLFLSQLQAMGRDAGSAIPELEKMTATSEALVREFAPVIEAIKGK